MNKELLQQIAEARYGILGSCIPEKQDLIELLDAGMIEIVYRASLKTLEMFKKPRYGYVTFVKTR